MHALQVAGLLLSLGAVAGCRDAPDTSAPDHHSPESVRVVRAVTVSDPSPPLGAYTSFIAVRPNGAFFITDVDRGRVVAYDSTGSVLRQIGAPGDGPGEFRMPATTEVVGDSLLVVADLNARAMVVFDLRSWSFERTIHLEGFRNWAADWSVRNDTATFAALDAGGAVAVWPTASDTAMLVGALPESYMTGRPRGLLRRYGRIGVAMSQGGLVAHLPTEDGVRRVSTEGALGPLIPLPVRARRGIPEALHALKASTSRERTESFPLASLNVGLASRSDGRLVAYHWEYDPDEAVPGGDGAGGPGMSDIRVFASLLSPGLDSACVDIRLPVDTDIPPFPVTVGDTTFIFARSVDLDRGSVQSTLVALHLDPASCHWEQLQSRGD